MSSFFAVGGNPFSTPVGQKIEQATDGSLASENWALNMEICDLINETEDGPKDAIKALRKRLQQAGKNYTIVIYSLTVLETCVKNCGKRFHVLVCSKEFVGELVKLIGPKNEPPPVVQEKVLNLIQSWADAFRNHQDLSGVVQIYQELRSKGIEFPMTDLDSMAPIHTPKKSVKSEPSVTDSGNMGSPQVSMVEVSGPLSADQIAKLKSDVDVLQTNMTVFNEMLSEMKPGNEHPSDIELFHELYTTLAEMQKRLVELISKLSNDEITADLLRINDDLNNLFLRYSRYEKNRGVANTENGQELIDLNSEASASIPAVTKQFEAMGVGSQLAGLSTVTARSGQQKDVDDTDFDVFAQSRKVTYNSSTMGGSTYESNSKPDQVSGSLGAVSEARAQGQSMHKESDFDEMAAWLEQEGGQRGIEESLTSSEFERFLAERAAAAENLPTASNTSTPRKGKDPQENSLYAL